MSEELESIEKATNKITGTRICKIKRDRNNFSQDLKIQEEDGLINDTKANGLNNIKTLISIYLKE